jgi:hypothetical protein
LKRIALCILFIAFSASADLLEPVVSTKTPEDDKLKIQANIETCQVIDALLVKNKYKVNCFNNYQHYGPSTKTVRSSNAPLRIAGYNLLHPGTSKSLFKDYSLIAKIMNNYDVIAGLEILNTVGHDKANDEAVLALISGAPKMVADLKILREKTTEPKKLKEIDEKINKLAVNVQLAKTLYRGPGYFKILTALKKLDPAWGLILSPRGDSALQGSVEEMVGFFYRASVVTPVTNPHCSEYKVAKGGVPVACIINLGPKFMGKDHTRNFARRPFIGSFRSNLMKFSLVSMHVVFTFSGDEEAEKKLMKDVFGVESAGELGTGINSSNFARFAEIKLTLDFMNRFRNKYNDNNIMLISDTNINASNLFWPEVLKSFPGGSVLIDEPTTLSPPRYSGDGNETNGVANSYDHFIFDKNAFPGCDDGQVYNYYKSDIQSDISKTYLVRNKNPRPMNGLLPLQVGGRDLRPVEDGILDGDIPPDDDPIPTKLDYSFSAGGEAKMNKMVGTYSVQLKSNQTVRRNEIINDDFQVQERIDGFKRRVFVNQLTNAFYYRFYQEILSDHFPVSINCN